MNRHIPLLFILTCLSAVSVFAQQPATRRLANYANNISRFTKDCPQEKVYLHFDNTGYYAGDTIWFKAYTVTADEVKPTTLSRVLHVELLTPRGEVTDSRKLKIQDGQCHGEFALPRDCKGGFYEVRAYTRAMLNFGDTHIFSRVFPIYSEPEQAGNYQEKDMDSFAGEKKERPEPEKADRVNLYFFPEGGHAVLGIPARVAFRATGKNGEDINVTGTLYNANHEPVASLATIHQGMGVFEFTPQAQEYEATVNYEGKEYTIPFKDILSEGYTMNVDNLNPDLMRISVHKSDSLPNDTIAVSVTCRGKLCTVEAFVLGKEPYAFRISKEKLPAGCIQVTAFNAAGDILAERLAFNTRNDMFVPIRVTQDKTSYKPFEEVNLQFDVHDPSGKPVETTFSLAVRDAATTPRTAYQDNILTDLLLSSDVKGYIQDPMQYFTDDSRATRTKLDLLMMVQGWRRYSWQQMAGVKPIKINHFAEEGLTLWGKVKTLVKNKPRANADILFWMKNDSLKAEVHGSGHTDEQGNFYCILPDSVDITGKWSLTLSVSDEGKQRHSQILINRHFSPEKRSYTFFDTYVNDSVAHLEADTLGKINMAETQMLQEVEVKKYLPRKLFTPEMVMDVEKDINECLDKGEDVPPTIGEYVAARHPVITYDETCQMYTYGNMAFAKRIKYVLFRLICQEKDRPKFRHIPVYDIDISSVRSIRIHERNLEEIRERYPNLYISDVDEENKQKQRYIDFENNEEEPLSIDDTTFELRAIVVAELYDEVYNDSRKGMRQTFYEGYSPVKECYNLKSSNEALGYLNYRRTLYWNPDVKTDAEGKASIRLFNNGTCRKMEISAEGCDGGTPVISSDVPSTH